MLNKVMIFPLLLLPVSFAVTPNVLTTVSIMRSYWRNKSYVFDLGKGKVKRDGATLYTRAKYAELPRGLFNYSGVEKVVVQFKRDGYIYQM